MSSEDFFNQPGFGPRWLMARALSLRFKALANLNRAIKIRRPRAVGAEYVQFFKALRLNHLQEPQ